jgi:hypothetical protein
MIADIGRLSSRYNDADVVVAMARGAGKHIAVYDPRNREIHDDYMDWSTEVRSGVGGRLQRRRCGHRAARVTSSRSPLLFRGGAVAANAVGCAVGANYSTLCDSAV